MVHIKNMKIWKKRNWKIDFPMNCKAEAITWLGYQMLVLYILVNLKPKAEVYLPPSIAKQNPKLTGTFVFCLLQTIIVATEQF